MIFLRTIFTFLLLAAPVAAAAQEEADSLQNEPRRGIPVQSGAELQTCSVVDTLATSNDEVSIVLYNDNTWRYIRNRTIQRDSTLYSKYWDTEKVLPYYDVPLTSLPEQIDVELVDTLRHYHYPKIGRITSRYGIRHRRAHNGVDLALTTGDPIYAVFDGKVRYAKVAGGYGNLVIIRHDNGLETYYGHLSKILVEPDQWVAAGQTIGLGGSTGRSTGPHLHFETRYYGQSFDPERVVDFTSGDLRRDFLVLKRRHFSIYSKAGQDFESEIEEEEAIKKAEAEAKAMKYYTVRKGDNLGRIAQKTHSSVKLICKLNGIKPTTIIQPGKRLRVH